MGKLREIKGVRTEGEEVIVKTSTKTYRIAQDSCLVPGLDVGNYIETTGGGDHCSVTIYGRDMNELVNMPRSIIIPLFV